MVSVSPINFEISPEGDHSPAPLAPVSSRDRNASARFFHFGFISCLILQRFGYELGGSAIYAALPLFIACLSWLLATGRAKFGIKQIMWFILLGAVAVASSTVAMIVPDNRVGISFLSPIALFLNCMLFLVRPGDKFERGIGLDIFIFYCKILAIFGISQYFLQFIGIKIFSFSENFPILRPILADSGYNFNAVTDYYSRIGRSNGFFLLEPSIFSQVLIIAVCVEYFIFERFRNLPLFGIAYLVSGSGTGLLCLAVSVPIFALVFYRQAMRLIPFFMMGSLAVVLLALLFPDQIAYLIGRSAELNAHGSSGNARYVEQFNSINAVIDEFRTIFIGFGPGATERATFVAPGSFGSIQKLTIDYGLFGMFVYTTLVISAIWRTDMAILPILALIVYALGGNYIFLSPIITLLLLLCAWCDRPPPAATPEERK